MGELSLTMDWDITDITMVRDPLMLTLTLTLMLLTWDMDTPMPLELTAMLLMCHLGPVLVLTQSPRDLIQLPRELSLTMVLAITMASEKWSDIPRLLILFI